MRQLAFHQGKAVMHYGIASRFKEIKLLLLYITDIDNILIKNSKGFLHFSNSITATFFFNSKIILLFPSFFLMSLYLDKSQGRVRCNLQEILVMKIFLYQCMKREEEFYQILICSPLIIS